MVIMELNYQKTRSTVNLIPGSCKDGMTDGSETVQRPAKSVNGIAEAAVRMSLNKDTL